MKWVIIGAVAFGGLFAATAVGAAGCWYYYRSQYPVATAPVRVEKPADAEANVGKRVEITGAVVWAVPDKSDRSMEVRLSWNTFTPVDCHFPGGGKVPEWSEVNRPGKRVTFVGTVVAADERGVRLADCEWIR